MIKTNGVIRQNSVWPCVQDHTALWRMHKIMAAWNVAVNLLPPLNASNFGKLTAFRAIFSHIFTAHAQSE